MTEQATQARAASEQDTPSPTIDNSSPEDLQMTASYMFEQMFDNFVLFRNEGQILESDQILKDLELYVKGTFESGNFSIDPSLLGKTAFTINDLVRKYIDDGIKRASERRPAVVIQPRHVERVASNPNSDTNRSFWEIARTISTRALSVLHISSPVEYQSGEIPLQPTKKLEVIDKPFDRVTYPLKK